MSADHVKIKLAHPLRTEDAVDLALREKRVYAVGEEIVLPRAYAMRLVTAGFVAGADPAKPETVRAALKPFTDKPATPAEPAAAAGAAKTGKPAKSGEE